MDAATAIVAVTVGSAVLMPVLPAVASLHRTGIPGWPPSRILDAVMRLVGLTTALGLVAIGVGEATTTVGSGALALGLDRAGALLLGLVVVTGAVVAAFSRRGLDGDPRLDRLAAAVGLLLSGAALTVVAGSLVGFLLGWIVSARALVALITHRVGWRPAERARVRVGRQLLVGDLILSAVVATVVATEGLGVDPASAAARLEDRTWLGLPAVDVVAVALVLAAASRSSMVPFHRWLVRTIVAPTPVSAVVHAGFIGGAGVMLVVLGPLVTLSAVAMHLLFVLGFVTVVVAAAASAVRADVKGSLAWSTVAQMGFMAVQGAVGALSSVVAHLVGHGMYKAALFLGAGGTVTAEVAGRRQPAGRPAPAAGPVAVTIAVAGVGAAMLVLPPDLNDAGTFLVAIFATLTVGHAVRGWLHVAPFGPARSTLVAAIVAPLLALTYLGGLRLVELFTEPTVKQIDVSGAVSLPVTVGGVVVAVVAVAVLRLLPTTSRAAERLGAVVAATATPVDAGRRSTPPRGGAGDPAPTAANVDGRRRVEASGDLARALDVVAPQWPLSTFVAVNPLGGLEHLGFSGAGAAARRLLHARTEQSLADLREAHRHGFSDAASVRSALWARLAHIDPSRSVELDGRTVTVEQVVLADLFHGPEPQVVAEPRTHLEAIDRVDGGERSDAVDTLVGAALARHIGSPAGSAWSSWRSGVAIDPRVAAIAGDAGASWLGQLPGDPLDALVVALDACGVADDDRVAAIRGHLARLRGWAGLAVWRTEWADTDDPHPPLAPVEVVAMRASLEAAVVLGSVGHQPGGPAAATVGIDARVDAVLDAVGVGSSGASAAARSEVATLLGELDDHDRPALLREAQELTFEDRLLSRLDRPCVAPAETAAAQLVFCIDVRSERLRRRLEELGPWQTSGFAGFFGLPVRVARAGWRRAEASCPVLVRPAGTVVEDEHHPVAVAATAAATRSGALGEAWHTAKHGAGGAFALAEATGWVTGPLMAARTLRPGRHRPVAPATAPLRFAGDDIVGLSLEQRVFFAEAILTTMGITTGFAPVVVLCGHTSRTTNNPHASALDCGACGGNPGDLNARAVAALLNDVDVRDGLAVRGIEIPAATWFVGALHETVADHVELLPDGEVPVAHLATIERLRRDLAGAGAAAAAERAASLPGPAERVRDRGLDWAQVRPEWGLAGNAAFVIAPRALTAGVDLGGRVFLHSYDAAADGEGRVLETIMTAPVVVAHWISSQYYFSSVDPASFGAGDKMLHNPVGSAGVVLGDGGDLRVGLPWQSTHVGDERFHQPLRLLVAIEAPLSRIEEIIERNSILQTLVGGGWIRLAARESLNEGWATRSPSGTWTGRLRTLPVDWSAPSDGATGTRMVMP